MDIAEYVADAVAFITYMICCFWSPNRLPWWAHAFFILCMCTHNPRTGKPS